MSIERGDRQKNTSRSNGVKPEVGLAHHHRKHCAPLERASIEFGALSINISLLWSEANATVAFES